MENSKKTIKILIIAAVLIALAIIGNSILNSRENVESESQKSAPEASESLPQDTTADTVPSSDATGDQSADETPAVKESTPAERESRSSSPSDAASYSEDDLPPDYTEVP